MKFTNITTKIFAVLMVLLALSQVAVVYAIDRKANVIACHLTEESAKEHHTSEFEGDLGFSVRRGQEFSLFVTLSEPLPGK